MIGPYSADRVVRPRQPAPAGDAAFSYSLADRMHPCTRAADPEMSVAQQPVRRPCRPAAASLRRQPSTGLLQCRCRVPCRSNPRQCPCARSLVTPFDDSEMAVPIRPLRTHRAQPPTMPPSPCRDRHSCGRGSAESQDLRRPDPAHAPLGLCPAECPREPVYSGSSKTPLPSTSWRTSRLALLPRRCPSAHRPAPGETRDRIDAARLEGTVRREPLMIRPLPSPASPRSLADECPEQSRLPAYFHSTGVHLISALKLSNEPGPPPNAIQRGPQLP